MAARGTLGDPQATTTEERGVAQGQRNFGMGMQKSSTSIVQGEVLNTCR